MAERTVNYIEPEVLAARLLGEVASERELVVVDVRDDDFDERVIRGALHVPSAEFPERVDEVLSAHSHGKDVVFHCSLSQMRGPSCARFFASEMKDDATSHVYVLRNGFRHWSTRYGGNPRLTEPRSAPDSPARK
eukprot:CAMPEP_0177647018 /NCGR_PEP_ID=MMETSP0447-20121125/10081_1 /TAXON_ID=0 /ORGANISM="Stygamoeba regulata, Strain BSH-02190019" /LENGTH=134 /DNA_ID=CAMNT_0019149585 /DNA_START=192 /DNA_END=596 /DNA_ORIENTATION=-